MDLVLLAAFGGGFWVALDFPLRSARYPLTICALGVLIALVSTARDVLRLRRAAAGETGRDGPRLSRRALVTLGLMPLLLVLAVPLGLLWGAVVWLAIFLRLAARMSWPLAALDALLAGAALYAIEWSGLGELPPGLLR